MQNSANLFSHEVHAGVQIVFHFFLGEKQSMQIKPVSKRQTLGLIFFQTQSRLSLSDKPDKPDFLKFWFQQLKWTLSTERIDPVWRHDPPTIAMWGHRFQVRFLHQIETRDVFLHQIFSWVCLKIYGKKNSSSGRLKRMSPFLERFPGLLSGTHLVRIHVETAALGDGSHLAVQCLAPLEASTDSLSLHVLSSQTSFGGS